MKKKKKTAAKSKTKASKPKKLNKTKSSAAKKAKKPVKKKSKTKVSKKSVSSQKSGSKIDGTLIGHVTHFFPHVDAAALKIEKSMLRKGDSIRIKGHTTDIILVAASLQLDHVPIDIAKKGDEIGIRVPDRVREGDEVYKL